MLVRILQPIIIQQYKLVQQIIRIMYDERKPMVMMRATGVRREMLRKKRLGIKTFNQ